MAVGHHGHTFGRLHFLYPSHQFAQRNQGVSRQATEGVFNRLSHIQKVDRLTGGELGGEFGNRDLHPTSLAVSDVRQSELLQILPLFGSHFPLGDGGRVIVPAQV